LNSITKLIKYPDPLLKNRTWKTYYCFDSHTSSNLIRAYVESSYYENGKDYVRYYEVFCENLTKKWNCSSPDDMFQFRKSKQAISVLTKLSTNEILQLREYINKIDMSSIRNDSLDIKIPLVKLLKDGNVYYAGLGGKHLCYWWVKIFQLDKNKFRSEKPEKICIG